MARKTDLIKGYPDELVLEEVRRVAGLVGKPVLTRADFDKHSEAAASVLARRFGSWRAALERAGIGGMYLGGDEGPVRAPNARYSDEDLIEEVRRVASELAEKPLLKRDEFAKHSRVSLSALERRFGGWEGVLERVGLRHLFAGGHGQANPPRMSDEELLVSVRQVAESAERSVLTRADFSRHCRISLSTFERRFGGWQGVLERAGLAHLFAGRHRRSYSDEELLEKVRQVAELVEEPVITLRQFTKRSGISGNTIKERFGRWSDVLNRAGLGHRCYGEFKEDGRLYTDEELLEEVRRVAGIVEKDVLTENDFNSLSRISTSTPRLRFGSWGTALEHAGVGHMFYKAVEGAVSRAHTRQSREDMLIELKRVADLVGKPVLITSDFDRLSKMRARNYNKRFGSWESALEAAGLLHMCFGKAGKRLRRVYHVKHTDEALIEELQRVAGLVERSVLTTDDFQACSKIGVKTICLRFGNWRAALERAGLGHAYSLPSMRPRPVKYTNETLLTELLRVAELVNKPVITKADFKTHATIGLGTYDRNFGTWQAALESAGLGDMYCRDAGEPARLYRVRSSDEELVEEVRRVARLVGKPVLSTTDFNRHSKSANVTLAKRFGSWKAALERAGLGHMYSGAEIADLQRTQPSRHLSDGDILELIRQVAEKTGRDDLPRSLFTSRTGITRKVIVRRFGNWEGAVAAVGLSAYNRSGLRRSEEKCFRNIAMQWIYYGRPPMQSELQVPPSTVKFGIYRKRWGSLRKALDAFLEWTADEQSSEVESVLNFHVMRRDGFICAVCGCGPASVDGVELRVAPVIPSEGETTVLSELRTFCGRCDPGMLAESSSTERVQSDLNNNGAETGAVARARRFTPSCPDEVLLDEVRRVAKLVGKPFLTMDEFHRHAHCGMSIFSRRFGGWGKTLERAGLGHLCSGASKSCSVYSDEQLLEELRRVVGLVRRPSVLMKDFVKRSDMCSALTIARRFGSWSAALDRAGLGSKYYRTVDDETGTNTKHSNEEILEEIRRVAKLVGKPVLTSTDFRKHSSVGVNTIKGQLGGDWRVVLELAGLGHMYSGAVITERQRTQAGRRLSDEDVLDLIRDVATRTGRDDLPRRTFSSMTGVSKGTVVNRFGSWTNARTKALS